MPMPTQEHHERKWDTYRLFSRLTSPPAPFPSAAWLKPWHESCGFLCMAHDFRVAWVDGQRAEASGGTKSVPLEPPYPSWILEADSHPRLLRGPLDTLLLGNIAKPDVMAHHGTTECPKRVAQRRSLGSLRDEG